jgi:hypothetical protein
MLVSWILYARTACTRTHAHARTCGVLYGYEVNDINNLAGHSGNDQQPPAMWQYNTATTTATTAAACTTVIDEAASKQNT